MRILSGGCQVTSEVALTLWGIDSSIVGLAVVVAVVFLVGVRGGKTGA